MKLKIQTHEVHRMYLEKTFNELIKKIRNTFELKNPIKRVFYYEHNIYISIKTEEDYEIMLLSNTNVKFIKLYFE